MGDKVQSMSAMDMGHGKLSDGNGAQTSTSYNSNYGYKKQQQKSKGSSYSKADKKSHDRYPSYPKSNGMHTSRPTRQNGRGQSYGSHEQSTGREKMFQNRGVKDISNTTLVSGELITSTGNGGTQEGKKKTTVTSLNHLLNFTIASTERRSSIGPGTLPLMSSGRRRRSRIGHSFNKEQFLQANCQFVVSVSGDYSIHSADPDLLVDWDSIEQVRLFCHQIPSCPICLYPPRAAKITRCGHVYCWSCLLHYLSLGDKKWRKCPICYESVYRKDIKSVTALASHQYSVGDTLTMKLMTREKGATLVLPRMIWAERKNELLTLKDTGINQFAKLLSATPTEVLDLITGLERKELKSQLASIDKDCASERCFVEIALVELEAREVALKKVEGIQQETADLAKSLKDAESILKKDTHFLVPTAKPVSISYAENYFESDFEAPFSEKESDEQQGTLDTLKPDRNSTESTQDCNSTNGVPLHSGTCSSEDVELSKLHVIHVVATSTSETLSPLCESPPVQSVVESSGVLSQVSELEELSPITSVSSSPGSSPISSTESYTGDPPSDSPRPSTNLDLIYFYQASDGQHLYIHPVNAKCLIKEYGGLENSPDEIKATVVEIDQLSMSEDVRARYRYLGHLPLTCELALCELDLKSPTLSRTTLASFSDEINNRRQKRMKKKRDERRREKRAEAKERQFEPTFIVPTSAHELTPEKFHDFLSLASSPTARSHLKTSRTERESDGVSPQGNEEPSAPSFAQALQGKPPPIWPIRSPPKPQGAVSISTTIVSTKKKLMEEDSEEGEVVPTFKDAFNVAVASASVSVMAAQKASDGKPGNKTAKKGRKKMVLFSTGSTRGTG